MRKLVITAAAAGLVLSGVAFAGNDSTNPLGIYAGAQAGWAKMNYTKASLEKGLPSVYTVSSIHNTGFAGRVFLGFNLNKYLAFETGYIYLPNVKYKFVGEDRVKWKQQYTDFVAKGTLPLDYGFSLFGKAGMAYASVDSSDEWHDYSGSGNQWVPTVGGGVDYKIWQGLSANIAYRYFFKQDHVQATHLVVAGLSYEF